MKLYTTFKGIIQELFTFGKMYVQDVCLLIEYTNSHINVTKWPETARQRQR
jgi:hypothetical protein